MRLRCRRSQRFSVRYPRYAACSVRNWCRSTRKPWVCASRAGEDVTARVKHQLLFGLESSTDYFIYSEPDQPFELQFTEPTGTRPTIEDALHGARLPTRAFNYDTAARIARLDLPNGSGPLVVDWSGADAELLDTRERRVDSSCRASLKLFREASRLKPYRTGCSVPISRKRTCNSIFATPRSILASTSQPRTGSLPKAGTPSGKSSASA